MWFVRSLWILLCAPTSEVSLNTSAPRRFSPRISAHFHVCTPRNLKRLCTEATPSPNKNNYILLAGMEREMLTKNSIVHTHIHTHTHTVYSDHWHTVNVLYLQALIVSGNDCSRLHVVSLLRLCCLEQRNQSSLPKQVFITWLENISSVVLSVCSIN